MKAKSMKAKRMVSVMLAVLLIFSLAIPCVANTTAVDENVLFSFGFEGDEVEETADGVLKWKGANFRNTTGTFATTWVSDADNDAQGEVSISTEKRSGSNALKIRGNSLGGYRVYKKINGFEGGKIYELTAWVKFVKGNGAESNYQASLFICDRHDGGSATHHTGEPGKTLNTKVVDGMVKDKAWFEEYDKTNGTDGEWVQYKRYFSHVGDKTKQVDFTIAINNQSDIGAYALIDDIQIRKVGNLVVSDQNGAEVSTILAGKTYTGEVLLANGTINAESYVGLQAIYEMVDGKKRLVSTEVFDANISLPERHYEPSTGAYRCSYYKKRVTLDLTGVADSVDKTYSAKIFVWNSFAGLQPAFLGEI